MSVWTVELVDLIKNGRKEKWELSHNLADTALHLSNLSFT